MKYSLILIFSAIILFSCSSYQYSGEKTKTEKEKKVQEARSEEPKIKVSKTVTIPSDGSAPIAGYEPAGAPDTVLTFAEVGEKYSVLKGQTVNFIYDGIDPESTFIIYESTLDGYNIELAYKTDPVVINFTKLCQIFIVASPSFTNVIVPENLRYEQVIWTPREDGSWEVRIGTVERGCQSTALQNLQKLRNKQYETNMPK